ncbi:MAG: hypothetical protein U0522_01280 [Candidatus Paceibacterota bacterium]
MKLSTKQTLILVILLVFFVLGGYYFLFVLIKNKNEKVSLFSQEIDLYLERESMRRTTEKTAEELSEKIQKLESYFLHKDEVVPFIESIEDAGGKSGVDVSIASVGVTGAPQIVESTGVGSGVVDEKKDEMLALRLDVKGSWGNVMNFVSYIENLPYKVSVDRVLFHKNSSVDMFFTAGEKNTASIGQKSSIPAWSATIEMSVLTLK